MNVMYASDDNYAEIMGVSILSLLDCNKEIDTISFYIIEDNISDNNKKRLISIVEQYHRKLIFIKKPDIREMLGVNLKTLRWSDSAYSRIFLKELFKEENYVEKILYIDCDTLIVDSLIDLWETDISDSLGAACLECMSNMHKRIIGKTKKDNYINSGILLLNVKRWIEEDVQAVCVNFIQKYRGKTEYVDQGVINGAVSEQFKLVSPRYNLTALAYDFTYEEMQIYRKPSFGYTKDEWQEAVKRPAIIHFTTSFLSIRPWYEGSCHPYAAQWKAYHDKSPWSGNAYRKLVNKDKRDKRENLYRKLPKRLAVHAAGFLHAYVKPIIYKLK